MTESKPDNIDYNLFLNNETKAMFNNDCKDSLKSHQFLAKTKRNRLYHFQQTSNVFSVKNRYCQ